MAYRPAAVPVRSEALRPGGRLILEDADPALLPLICPDEYGPEQQLAKRTRHAFRELMRQHVSRPSSSCRCPG